MAESKGGAPDDADTVLKFGDLIFLTSQEGAGGGVDGYLYSEGLGDEFLSVVEFGENNELPMNFRNCLFRVTPQMQYFAQAEFEEALKQEPPAPRRMIEHLKTMAEKQAVFNKKGQLSRSGEEVSYGQTVQLQHVISGKYISVFANRVAKIEAQCFQIRLHEGGSQFSWFVSHSSPCIRCREPTHWPHSTHWPTRRSAGLRRTQGALHRLELPDPHPTA